MIVVTQFLLRYFVVQRVLLLNGLTPGLENELFALVVLSTIMIAAGGYIINDYFDVKTDLLNHPDTVVVDKVIKRRWAITLHFLLTVGGLFIGMYAALQTGYLRLALFHFFAAILLWFYSTHFKKSLLVGNIVVSLLTAAVAFMPLVYEFGVFEKNQPGYIGLHPAVFLHALKMTTLFSVFAFITSMAREIIKDMEDVYGDAQTGGRTLPISWGMQAGRLFAFFLLIITAMLILFVVYNTVRAEREFLNIHNLYLVALLIIPLLLLGLYVLRAKESKQFKRASLALKIIMLAGLSYAVIFYFH
jgi:4-hydroxybenzoate polyprenyltransferase